jgi:hypothetical protein
MSSNISAHHGGAVGAAGRLDVRAMMRHYLAPFKAAEPWRDTLETIGRSSFATQRNCHDKLIALSSTWNTPEKKHWAIKDALAIRDAVTDLGAVWEAADALDEAMAPPPEEIIRAILGAMLSILRAKPTEGAEIYVDALVWELTDSDAGPFCAPAIAAAAKEIWTTKTFPPSIPEFMKPAKQHQARIEAVRAQLTFISEAYCSADEVLITLAPEKLPKQREWSDDEVDDCFGPE